MNFATHTSAMVFYRKEHGLSQTEVARAMATTQSAVARLEKRLLTGADVTLSALQRYAEAIGLSIELTLKPVKQRYGFFPTAEAAIAAAVHTSACEGRTVPANEVEDRSWSGSARRCRPGGSRPVPSAVHASSEAGSDFASTAAVSRAAASGSRAPGRR